MSKQPIDEDGLAKASEDVLKEKHKALRILQAKVTRANMTEVEQEAFELDEENPPEADPKTEFEFKQELDLNKLQVQNEGRQLGYLLVQKTKGETQLQLRRWIQSTNGWEAWRQLNLLHTTSKRSTHFKLLSTLMNPNFDTQPASFLQQFNAWKEQVVSDQQLSVEQLPDFIKLIAVVNGLKGSVRNLVLFNLDSDSNFGDLDSLLARYVDIHDQHAPSLDSICDRACRDKPESIGKGNDVESNPSFEQQLEEGGHKEGKGKDKSKPTKSKGEAYPPPPPAYKGKGRHAQLPTRQRWCSICRKKGHKTQACWWNSNQQHQQHNNHNHNHNTNTSTNTTNTSTKTQPNILHQQSTNHVLRRILHQCVVLRRVPPARSCVY